MRNRRTAKVLTGVVLSSVAVAGLSSAPAYAATPDAASVPSSAAASCTVTPGAPFKSGSTVRANYASSGCAGGWYISFYLQRQRAWGWETLDSVDYTGNRSGALSYNCSGDGTYTYRNFYEATNPAGITFTKASSSTRFTC